MGGGGAVSGETAEAWVHPTALVEEEVTLGAGTRIWDGVHIRHHTCLGRSCIVGEKTHIAYGVRIGDFVKINAGVYICTGVEIADFCMIAAHVVFTNDRFPRAGNVDLTGPETSEPTEETLSTAVNRGATIGANATIGPGVTLGEFSMVGMGAVVTRNVAPHQLVVGNPARPAGWHCCCGEPVFVARRGMIPPSGESETAACARCGRTYGLDASGVRLDG